MSSFEKNPQHVILAFSKAETYHNKIHIATLVTLKNKSSSLRQSADPTERRQSRCLEELEAFLEAVRAKRVIQKRTSKEEEEAKRRGAPLQEEAPKQQKKKIKNKKRYRYIGWKSNTTPEGHELQILLTRSERSLRKDVKKKEKKEDSLPADGERYSTIESTETDRKSGGRSRTSSLHEGEAEGHRDLQKEALMKETKKERVGQNKKRQRTRNSVIYMVKARKERRKGKHPLEDEQSQRIGSPKTRQAEAKKERKKEEHAGREGKFSHQKVKQATTLNRPDTKVPKPRSESERERTSAEARQRIAGERRAQLMRRRAALAAETVNQNSKRVAEMEEHSRMTKRVMEGKNLKTKTQKALEKVEQERRRKQAMIMEKLQMRKRIQMKGKEAKRMPARGCPEKRKVSVSQQQASGPLGEDNKASSSSNLINFLESGHKSNSNSTTGDLVTSTGDRAGG